MKRKIKGVIFDAEGVIFDSEHFWDKIDTKFLKTYGIKYDAKVTKSDVTGLSFEEGVKYFKKKYKLKKNVSELITERFKIARSIFEKEAKFISGFKNFLIKLKQMNLTIGVATSLNPQLLKVIDRKLKINKIFNGNLYDLSMVDYKSKPEPDIYKLALKKLKLDKKECVAIEDSPNGILSAKRAGIFCYGLSTTFSKAKLRESDKIVRDFKEIYLDLKLL